MFSIKKIYGWVIWEHDWYALGHRPRPNRDVRPRFRSNDVGSDDVESGELLHDPVPDVPDGGDSSVLPVLVTSTLL